MTKSTAGKTEDWERQPGEGQQAFDAFRLYRELGADRSTARVGQELGKSKALMDRWSARWGWVRRAAAWDAHLDDIRRQEAEKSIEEMTKRHISMAVGIFGKAAARLAKLTPEELDPDQVLRYAESAAKLERLSRGQVTARTEVVGNPLADLVNALGIEKPDADPASD